MSADDLLIRPPGSSGDSPTHRPYDFARPLSFSLRQIRSAEGIHDVLARDLALRLSDRLGTATEVHCTGIHEVLAADFERSRTVPTALFRLRLGGEADHAIGLDLAPAFALLLVERHLGGTGPLDAAPRVLTALEQMVVQRHWLPEILASFAEAWHAAAPQPDAFDSQPGRLPLAEPDAAVISADFEIVLDEQSVALAFCYPAEAMRALLSGHASEEAHLPPPPASDALNEVPLDIQVELGRTTLSVADLVRLVPGDVLTLSRQADEPLPVHAGDRLLFDARPGASGHRIALQILSLYSVRPDPPRP